MGIVWFRLQKPPKKGMETINNVCPCHLFHKQDLGKAKEQKRPSILSERQKYNRTGFHSKNPCQFYHRTITSLFVTMIDMSAAFDTVSRNILLNQLEVILEPHEMRMLHLLINEVKLNVRIGHTIR